MNRRALKRIHVQWTKNQLITLPRKRAVVKVLVFRYCKGAPSGSSNNVSMLWVILEILHPLPPRSAAMRNFPLMAPARVPQILSVFYLMVGSTGATKSWIAVWAQSWKTKCRNSLESHQDRNSGFHQNRKSGFRYNRKITKIENREITKIENRPPATVGENRDVTKIENLDFWKIRISPKSKIGGSLKSKLGPQTHLSKRMLSQK